jgi:HPt (histidine-containing phosphotransfer) domain-containing protein
MFLSNGFNDFIAKPIDTNELRTIVKKYLPPEKVCTMAVPENSQARLSKEDELRRKATVTFVKENCNTFAGITQALSTGDIKTAHRIAHTLKSSAGYLGKKELAEVARDLESSLQNGTADHTPEQLSLLEKELASALLEFEPIVKAVESEKPEAVLIDAGELKSLLAGLRPLLEKGDFGAADFVEKLQGITGMEDLAARVDDYDFEGALKLLNKICP